MQPDGQANLKHYFSKNKYKVMREKLKFNPKISLAIFTLLITINFQGCNTDDSGENNLSLEIEVIDPNQNAIVFHFEMDNPENSSKPSRSLIRDYVKKIYVNNDEIDFDVLEQNNYTYYPCKKGTLTFTVEANDRKTINYLPEYTEVIALEFSSIHEKAKCNTLTDYPQPTIEDKGCLLQFKWKGKNEDIRVSWNGINGTYTKTFSKNANELGEKFDVWYFLAGKEEKKEPYFANGTFVPKCKSNLPPENLKEEFIAEFKKLGKSPNSANSATLTTAIKMMCSSNISPVLDGKKESSIEGLFQSMKNQADDAEAENGKIWFECVENSVKISQGKVIGFEVKTRRQ